MGSFKKSKEVSRNQGEFPEIKGSFFKIMGSFKKSMEVSRNQGEFPEIKGGLQKKRRVSRNQGVLRNHGEFP